MKKLLILLAVLTACLVVFAACGSGKTPEGTTADNKTTVAPTPGETEPAATEKGPDFQTEPVTESGGETNVPTDTDSGEETVGETTPPETETTHTHAWGDWSTTKEATCTEAGVSERACACGEKEEETIDALGHTPGAEATCTTNQTCTVCGTELTAAKGHTPGAEATCTTNQTCTVCGIELTAAKGHTPGAEATCTAAQTCTVCGTELAAALGHTEVTDAAVAPTVTESGLTEGKHCSVCDEVLVEQEVVPATGSLGLAYELNDDGTAYIVTGIGTCEDSAVYIPEVYDGLPVNEISRRAFYTCATITEITIPASIKTIGTQIFYKAENLHTVYYNSSYASADNTFLNQSTIKKVVLGGVRVPKYVLNNCSSVTEIIVLDSVTSIEEAAFSGCSHLERITLPFAGQSKKEGYETRRYPFGYIFGTSSYAGGVATEQYISSVYGTLYYIPESLKSVTITSGNLLCNEFQNCSGLTSIEIPDSVTNIGREAFSGCTGLTSIVIPDSVTSIGYYAFSGCTGLSTIDIPDSVTSIDNYAFRNCSGLASVVIGNSATSVDGQAFSGCTSLTSITVAEGNPTYHSDGNCLIETARKTVIAGFQNSMIPSDGSVTSIGEDAFSGCTGLTSITIPDSVTSIGEYAFYNCTGLTSIEIPDSVTSIGGSAFSGCTGLTSIEIPDSVTSIGSSAFEDCTEVYYEGTIEQWCSITFDGSCVGSTTVLYIGGEQVSRVTLPDSVTSIGDWVFSDCTDLTSIEIPNSVTSIGYYAFSDCKGLTSIVIPDSVTSIGEGAFSWCTSLTSVTIPDSVISIGESMFNRCTSLTYIEIPDSVTSIGDGAFYGCTGLTSVVIPASVTNISDVAFYLCSRSLTIYGAEGSYAETFAKERGFNFAIME